MADHISITPGTGTTIATDDIAGTHYQRIKLTHGVDGVAVDCSGSNPLPTVLTAGSAAVGKLTANDGVDIGDVTINNTAGAGVYVRPGTGVNLDTSAVAVTSALPAGTNAIGKLAANDGVDVGDVTINNAASSPVYIAPGTGVNLNTSAVIVSTLPSIPAGTNAIGKLAANDGVDIGDVTVNNVAGSPVYIAPGTGVNLNTSNVTVGAAIPAGTNYIGKTRLTDGTLDASLVTVGSRNILPVGIYDGSGNQITSFGGGGGSSGTLKKVLSTITRPGDTTAYTAGDVFGDTTYATLAVGSANGDTGRIVDAGLTLSVAPSTRPDFRVFFFDTAPSTFADNAVFAPTGTDLGYLIGWLDFPGSSADIPNGGSGSTNLVYPCPGMMPPHGMFFKCGASSQNIFAYVVTLSGRTPAASEVVNLKIGVMLGC